MSKKVRVGVVFGGKSGEHEVSIQSAKSVMSALHPERYEVVPIGIDKQGKWSVGSPALKLLDPPTSGPWARISERLAAEEAPGDAAVDGNLSADGTTSSVVQADSSAQAMLPGKAMESVDVLVPVLHGSFGEDGTVQGLFELLGLPYVGAGVAASAVGMDKVLMKRVFTAAGIPQVDYVHCRRKEWESNPERVTERIEREVGYPCFVKPANLGSSVGISKVKDRDGLGPAMELAAQYDTKIIVEQGLDVREIEIAVLGNESPKASVPGEILPSNEFYDYAAKYVGGTSDLIIPAPVDEATTREIQCLAIDAFQAIDCSGLARVDFFIERSTGRVLLNEINTMPGFTQYSMYPKLWEATGVSYHALLDELIHLAIERADDRRRTRTDFEM